MKLTIEGRLESLNTYINACRRNVYTANNMKRRDERLTALFIRQDLRGVHLTKPVWLTYYFYEKDCRRDWDNVTGYAHKIIQDALVDAGVLLNDSQKFVKGYTDNFLIDKKKPRIEVEIEEA